VLLFALTELGQIRLMRGACFLGFLACAANCYCQSDQSKVGLAATVLKSIPTWLLVVLTLVAIALVRLAYVQLFVKDGYLVAFEELSAARETRLNQSRALTGLMIELLKPRQLSHGEFQMDIMPGTEEPGFSGVMPALEPKEVKYEASDHPVKIAELEFVPGEVFAFFWRRRITTQCIEGWLDCQAAEAIVSATHKRHRFLRSAKTQNWVFGAPGRTPATRCCRCWRPISSSILEGRLYAQWPKLLRTSQGLAYIDPQSKGFLRTRLLGLAEAATP
jgi:hypothetical protein